MRRKRRTDVSRGWDVRRVSAVSTGLVLAVLWCLVLVARSDHSPLRSVAGAAAAHAAVATGSTIAGAPPPAHPRGRPRRVADGSPVRLPAPRLPIRVVPHARGRVFALTIDDGPNPVYTPRMLAILRRHHAHATFCLIGEWVTAYPALVRAEAAAGDRLCDHTYTHDEGLEHRPLARVASEIDGTLHALHTAAPGVTVYYYRSPGGNFGPKQDLVAARAGLLPLAWNVDTNDWRGLSGARIYAALRAGLHPGAIMLVHDGGGNRNATLSAVDHFLTWATQHGYRTTFPTA